MKFSNNKKTNNEIKINKKTTTQKHKNQKKIKTQKHTHFTNKIQNRITPNKSPDYIL